jgi:hypothetical protein
MIINSESLVRFRHMGSRRKAEIVSCDVGTGGLPFSEWPISVQNGISAARPTLEGHNS